MLVDKKVSVEKKNNNKNDKKQNKQVKKTFGD